mmetsp:Transcript_28915/g.42868  ORF Transcript_28915/g.42868 Transcript_28915/m.42868 type:complete len:288 (+) Transcript_28915:152-1015(+)|eukprot:CAMPEP_0195518100 /NCGR_PEP_ID=MMETSP0794_2-20130614/12238_1 /TAXON_ID=515487 /ORGANISM="Stephanopyxis turris, Strain CCMP 815" /LENGTH=287 /DNA_ID=CAMNT_0040647011 /DNA_START=128 /DNA_END=991 /DNA_ORIENTATION=+
MKTQTTNQNVSFAQPLVTAIHYRPTTLNTDKRLLFYSADDYRAFCEKRKRQQIRKQQKKEQKKQQVTSILILPKKLRDTLEKSFYSDLQVQGFLKDHIKNPETTPSFDCTEEEASECCSASSEDAKVDDEFSSFLNYVTSIKKEDVEDEINLAATQSNSFKHNDCDGFVSTALETREARSMVNTCKNISLPASHDLSNSTYHERYSSLASSIEKNTSSISNKITKRAALSKEEDIEDKLSYTQIPHQKNKHVRPLPPHQFGQQYFQHRNDNDVRVSLSQNKIANTAA